MLRRVAVALVVAWALAILCASLLNPTLTNDSKVARAYANVAFQLQTFRFHVGLVVLLAAMLAMIRRRWRIVGVTLLAASLGIAPEVRHAWPARGEAMNGTRVRVMSLNNEGLRENADAILAAIRDAAPDLIAFEQFAAGCDDALIAKIGVMYPHRISFPSPPFQGIALYSKWPAELTRAPDFHSDDHGRLLATTVTIAGRPTRVFVVHLTSPRTVDRVARNRRETATLIERLGGSTRPTIVVGDCNFALASQQAATLRANGLVDAFDRAGFGLRWTWQPFAGVPIARIDHAFVSADVGVVDARVLPDVGSDHRPICVDLTVPRQ